MYITYTYQDWMATPEQDRTELIRRVITSYKASSECKHALMSSKYFQGRNQAIEEKMVMQPTRFEVRDDTGKVTRSIGQNAIQGAHIYSNFFFHFVVQQNQYLLGGGVTLSDTEIKQRLGIGFDKALEHAGELALIHGVCWGFWNADHMEVIEAVRDEMSGMVTLADEATGEPGIGIQYWQIDTNRPMYVRLFEPDGVTVYREDQGNLVVHQAKHAYKVRVARDAAGITVTGEENYQGRLPLIPLYANAEKRSEFTPAIKSKIDAYDRISSDFVDNLDRANDVYWVLNNFGGSTADMLEMIEQINRLRIVANISDGMGGNSVAEPHAFEVPYEARRTALDLLERALYSDYMAMSMNEISGGSLTNVAIQAASTNLNLKCDRFEWQCFEFVRKTLALIGIQTEEIRFNRQGIANRSEIVSDIATMRGDIDDETALRLNPYIDQEMIPKILENLDAKALTGLSSADAVQRAKGGNGV